MRAEGALEHGGHDLLLLGRDLLGRLGAPPHCFLLVLELLAASLVCVMWQIAKWGYTGQRRELNLGRDKENQINLWGYRDAGGGDIFDPITHTVTFWVIQVACGINCLRSEKKPLNQPANRFKVAATGHIPTERRTQVNGSSDAH